MRFWEEGLTSPLLPSRGLAPSPPGRSCLSSLQSPLADLSFERLPPPPTAASWAEFLNASGNGKMESDFALLTLSDHEQRELYEAARIIQTAFRKYKVSLPAGSTQQNSLNDCLSYDGNVGLSCGLKSRTTCIGEGGEKPCWGEGRIRADTPLSYSAGVPPPRAVA